MTLASGTSLGPYQVLAPIGAGGMGEVYRARDPRLGRDVAVKIVPASASADPDRLRRFEQEARAAGALNHPNILAVYDVGTHDGTPYVVSELLEGETLGSKLAGSPLPLRKSLDYAIQVANGLAAAHAKGIVHRDLKPDNLFVTNDGRVKILDFGLAKLTEPQSLPGASQEATLSTPPLTTPGAIVGTVGYMSPEQAGGRPTDHRSDIFSFGAIFYEMLFGRRAFKGDTAAETMFAILKQDPLESSGTERVLPPDVTRVLRRCLEKSPDERFHSARDLAFHLEAISGASDAAALPVKRGPYRWPWALAAVLPVLLAAGFLGWRAWRAPQRAEPLQAVALTTLPGAELYPSFSPDGNHLAFTWTGPKGDNPDIYVQMIGSGPPLRLTTDPRGDLNPVWSPDGRWIAFLRADPPGPVSQSSRELRLIPPLGGPERKLTEVRSQEFFPVALYLAWSPDSSALVVTDSPGAGKPDALFVVSLENGEKRQLTKPEPPVVADTSPAVSPDGRSLIFHRRTTWSPEALYLLPLEERLTAGGEPTRLTLPTLGADYPAWTPNINQVLFSARGSLWRLAIDGANPAPERLPFVGEDGLMPVVSRPQPGRPSRLVYVRSFADENIWRIETSGPGAPSSSPPAVAISSTRLDIHPQFSPDGRRVAFTSTRSGDWEIWVADPDGSSAVQLTSMRARATGAPHWSPDGQRIVFASDREGEFEIYGVPASGGKPHRVTSHPAFDHGPGFSSDGKSIYFTSTRTGESQIWKVPASGGDAVQLTSNGGFASAEGPDGYLYYTGTSATASPLWRVPASGGQPVKVLEEIVWWNFQVLPSGIYYTDRSAGVTRLQFFDFATRRSTTVARNLGQIGGGLSATRDGRTVLFNRVDSAIDDLMLVERFR